MARRQCQPHLVFKQRLDHSEKRQGPPFITATAAAATFISGISQCRCTRGGLCNACRPQAECSLQHEKDAANDKATTAAAGAAECHLKNVKVKKTACVCVG